MRDQIELPLDALTAVLRWENVDQPHPVLASELRWRTADEQRRVDQATLAELDEVGLVTDGSVDQDFRDVMAVLARPTVEYFGWMSTLHGDVGVLVASNGSLAVLAITENDTVWLSQVGTETLAETLVAQMPPLGPARGRSLNIVEADADRPDVPDANLLSALMASPRLGAGQLYTAVRDHLGRRQKTTRPLTYMDIQEGRPAQGRWMTRTSVTGSGEKWVFAAPASAQGIVAKLNEMNRELMTA